jgi:hypothetical protein
MEEARRSFLDKLPVGRISQKVIDYRVAIIIFSVIATILLIWPLTKATIINDPDHWAHPNHPYVKLNKAILDEFGGANVLMVMVQVKKGADIFNPKALAKVKSISDRLSVMKGFIPPNFEAMTSTKAKYFKASSEGVIIQQLMPDTPTTPERIATIKEGVLSNPMVHKKLVSTDLKSALLMADFDKTVTVDEIYHEARRIAKEEGDEDHEVRIAGKPVQMGWANERQTKEMPALFLVVLVVLSIIYYFIFRSKTGTFFPILIGLMGGAFGMGWVPLCKVDFNLMSWGAPFIILDAGGRHAVQFLKRLNEELANRELLDGLKATIKYMWSPISVSIINAVGFAIIVFTPFENLKPAAIAAAFGLMWDLWLTLFFLPACLSYSKTMQHKKVEERVSRFAKFVGNVGKKCFIWPKWKIIVPFSLVGAFGIWFMVTQCYVGGFDWDNALYTNLAHRWKNLTIYQDQEAIKKAFSGAYPYNIYIEGKRENVLRDAELMRDIAGLQKFLESRPEITYTLSLPNYLVGMNILMHEGDLKFAHVPDDPALNAQYLFLLSTGYPGEFETAVDTVSWKNTVIKSMVSSGSPEIYDKLVQDTKEWIRKNWRYPHATPRVAGGFIGVSASMSEDARDWILPTLIALIIIIYVFCGVFFQNWVIPAFLIAPIVYGLILILGIGSYLTMSGKKLIDYGDQQFISLTLGTGIDASIYLIARYLEEVRKNNNDILAAVGRAWETTGTAVVYSSIALVVGYIPLMFVQTYWAYIAMGSAMTLFYNLVAALFVMPAMMAIFRPKFMMGKGVLVVPGEGIR